MSASVGTALKKVLTLLLSDENVRKKIGIAILTAIVAVIMPAIALAGIFSGSISIDTDTLLENIQDNLTEADIAMLHSVERKMYEIEDTMEAAGIPTKAQEAQMLYILALYDHANEHNFVERLVDCFSGSPSDGVLIRRINEEFCTEISPADFSRIANMYRPTVINTSKYKYPETKNNLDMVEWAIAAEKAGWGYVWGTFGYILTEGRFESKLAQYPEDIGPNEEFIRTHWIGCRTTDCVGFIKGYCWLDAEDKGIYYASNGMPDVDTDGLYNIAREKGPLDTMPELPGVVVWQDGHVGIYIGNGEVIEAMGTRYGVVKTQLSRGDWTRWLKVPSIIYFESETNPVS